MIQGTTDLEQHVGVDPRMTKYFIEVFASAMHFAGQPSDGAALFGQLGLDTLADMEGFRIRNGSRNGFVGTLVGHGNKRKELFSAAKIGKKQFVSNARLPSISFSFRFFSAPRR